MPPKNLVLKSKDGHIQLGVGRGNLCVPFEFYEALRAASYLGQ